MAKLLPSSTSAIIKSQKTAIVKPSKLLGVKSKTSALVRTTKESSSFSTDTPQVIEKKVVQIDKLLKDSLLLSKKEDETKRKNKEKEEFNQKERELESKKLPKLKGINLPSLPKMGFLDWIKNFITKTILGFFAVRLIDFLPQLLKILPVIIKVGDFFIDVGGKMLDGLVTFVDWGYKAIDGTRQFIKDLGGEGLAKNFDKFAGAVDNVIEISILAALATADSGGFGGGETTKDVVKSGAKKGLGRAATRFGLKYLGKGATKQILRFIKPIAGRAPLIGGLLEFGISWALGDPVSRAAFKGIGATLIGAIGTAIGGPIGLAIGGYAGGELGGVLYDMFFGGKKPPNKVAKAAGGGSPSTRGGKLVGRSSKRTIKKKKKPRTLSFTPRKIKPGASTGGEEKVRQVFPNPEKAWWDPFGVFTGKNQQQQQQQKQKPKGKQSNPQEFLVGSNDVLGRAKYFIGPTATLILKTVLGQKPDDLDYRNIAKGLSAFVQTTFSGGTLGFAGGGEVDAKQYFSGEDYTEVIAKTIKDSASKEVDTTIRNLSKELALRPVGREEEKQPPSPDIDTSEGGTSGGGTADTSLNPYRRAFLDTLAYAEGTANYPNTGYNTMFTGKQFSGFKDHPRQIQRSGKYASDAAGRYQFLSTTWDGLGLPDFSPANQDKGALKLLAPHVIQAIDKGDFATAFHGARKTWASLPGAGYGQPEKKMKTLVGYANARLEKYKKGQIGKPEHNDMSLNVKDLGKGDGKLRFGRTGSMSVAPGWSHAHFDTVDGTSQSVIIRDTIPLLKKMASSGLKPELADTTPILAGKNNEYYTNIIKSGIAQHTHRPGPRFDVNMPGFPLVPFKLSDVRNTPSKGEGINGLVPGSGKTALFHLGTKSNGYAFHGENFGVVPKNGMTLTLHKGEMFKVVDKDSVDLFGFDLTKEIIDIENKSQLVAKAPAIIEKLKSISGYTDYERPEPQVAFIPLPLQDSGGDRRSTSRPSVSYSGSTIDSMGEQISDSLMYG